MNHGQTARKKRRLKLTKRKYKIQNMLEMYKTYKSLTTPYERPAFTDSF